jgi:hypothetical protein
MKVVFKKKFYISVTIQKTIRHNENRKLRKQKKQKP